MDDRIKEMSELKSICKNCDHKLFYHYGGGQCLYDYNCQCSKFVLDKKPRGKNP